MKKFTRNMALIGLLLALSIGGILAQDDEPSAGDIAPAATLEAAATFEVEATLVAEPDGGQVTPDAPQAPAPSGDNINMPIWLAVIGSVMLALGGAAIGGGSVFVILTRWVKNFLADRPGVQNAELLANGAPKWALEIGYDFAKFMQAGGKALEEITDGKPIKDKPIDPQEWMQYARAAGMKIVPGTDGQFLLMPPLEAG